MVPDRHSGIELLTLAGLLDHEEVRSAQAVQCKEQSETERRKSMGRLEGNVTVITAATSGMALATA